MFFVVVVPSRSLGGNMFESNALWWYAQRLQHCVVADVRLFWVVFRLCKKRRTLNHEMPMTVRRIPISIRTRAHSLRSRVSIFNYACNRNVRAHAHARDSIAKPYTHSHTPASTSDQQTRTMHVRWREPFRRKVSQRNGLAYLQCDGIIRLLNL